MKANKEFDRSKQVYVQEEDHRYNLMPDITKPVVQEMLKQVREHPRLRPLIDGVMGEGASLVNLSVLTAEYGAKDQRFHPDTSTSFASYPVVAFQDTTEETGATQLCPGTQFCRSIQLEEGEPEDESYARTCKVRAFLTSTIAVSRTQIPMPPIELGGSCHLVKFGPWIGSCGVTPLMSLQPQKKSLGAGGKAWAISTKNQMGRAHGPSLTMFSPSLRPIKQQLASSPTISTGKCSTSLLYRPCLFLYLANATDRMVLLRHSIRGRNL